MLHPRKTMNLFLAQPHYKPNKVLQIHIVCTCVYGMRWNTKVGNCVGCSHHYWFKSKVGILELFVCVGLMLLLYIDDYPFSNGMKPTFIFTKLIPSKLTTYRWSSFKVELWPMPLEIWTSMIHIPMLCANLDLNLKK